jgi:putative ABC transport system permease protein
MWGYYFGLALRSSGRNKALTTLVIVLLAFGVAACMVSYAVFRVTTGNPVPTKSSQLFVPQVDNVGPSYNWEGDPRAALSYNDAMALWKAHEAKRQTILFASTWQLNPADRPTQAMSLSGNAVTADFFPMFDVPFLFGSGWAADDDARHATVAVISQDLNETLFSGRNSVGREIRLDGQLFRIIGVLKDWNPRPRFFDIGSHGTTAYSFDDAGDVYVPFARATDMKKDSEFVFCPTASWQSDTMHWDAYLHSECDRIDAWVQLDTPAEVVHYREFLHNYAAEQQRLGRFAWAPNIRLRNLTDWLSYQLGTPEVSSLSMLVSGSFLLIVLVNVVGLMLARFMRRAPEIGVRRALGASRAAIYRQFLAESMTVGLCGGLLGVVLTLLGVLGAEHLFAPNIARLLHADISLIMLTVLVAVAATVAAALYPTWRAAQIQPAWQIKIH